MHIVWKDSLPDDGKLKQVCASKDLKIAGLLRKWNLICLFWGVAGPFEHE